MMHRLYKLFFIALFATLNTVNAAPTDDPFSKRSTATDKKVDRKTEQRSSRSKHTDKDDTLNLEKLYREEMEVGEQDLFQSKSWYVPPPPPKEEMLPPPPPTAPPLPFNYMGKINETPTRTVYFLIKGDTVYSVSEGDVIDGTYKVEGAAGDQLDLIYLPLNIKQSLNIGSSS